MHWLAKNVALTVGVAILRFMLRAVERRIAARGTRPASDPAERWLAVTVNAAPETVAADPQVRRLQDVPGLKVRLTPAPGGRSTEIAARFTGDALAGRTGPLSRIAGRDPRQPVRRALRNTKSMLETGEVLRTEPTRPRTPGGRFMAALARRSGGEGRL
ncbi:hypothetical protein LO763_15660 [Glycomyces sp. A-F 0318]|uniref:hypothetical protein n=1 Tax=Glycomyces amatae TaxID=2881355 RepID=UPI001E3C1901|nr:hypothetical protein [Glycomyces amatae]MCD0445053.1 hypothetical protein [Glycomyces amatae]